MAATATPTVTQTVRMVDMTVEVDHLDDGAQVVRLVGPDGHTLQAFAAADALRVTPALPVGANRGPWFTRGFAAAEAGLLRAPFLDLADDFTADRALEWKAGYEAWCEQAAAAVLAEEV